MFWAMPFLLGDSVFAAQVKDTDRLLGQKTQGCWLAGFPLRPPPYSASPSSSSAGDDETGLLSYTTARKAATCLVGMEAACRPDSAHHCAAGASAELIVLHRGRRAHTCSIGAKGQPEALRHLPASNLKGLAMARISFTGRYTIHLCSKSYL